MIDLEEFGYRIPRRGWPGRRWAIARVLLAVTFRAAFLLLVIAAFVACTLLIGTSMNALPAGPR